MTRQEFDRIYSMVTSDNLDDVHLGMELLNNIQVPLDLLGYIWAHSRCNRDQLKEWNLFDVFWDKLSSTSFKQINPYDYTE